MPRARTAVRAFAVLALLALELGDVGPAAAQTPIVIPNPQQPPATPTPRRTTSRAAPDLSAGLPAAPTPVPPTPSPVPTEAARPATLTPTPVPPTPTPVVSIAVGPTPVPVAVLPTEPPEALAPPPGDDTASALTSSGPNRAGSVAASNPAPQRPARIALPFEPRPAPVRTFVRGLPTEPGAAGWLDDSLLWLGVPPRSQYDGTPYQAANCGPSALGMVLEAYGLDLPTAKVRDYANYLQGTYGYDDGIALDYLAEIGRRANLRPMGLYRQGGGYRRWSVDDVRAAVLKGYPVIALVVYRLLPGSGGYGGNINHYVVIDGLLGDDFLYNDSAYGGGGARALVITPEQLEDAWAGADIHHHAVAFGIGEGTEGLLGPDPTRLGRGGGDARLLATAASIDPRGRPERATAPGGTAPAASAPLARVAPPPDPAIAARDALLNAGRPGAAPLDTAPGGNTATASLLPSPPAAPEAADPTDDPDEPLPPRGAAAALLRVLVVVGGVGALFALLLLQAGVARLTRRREP